MAKSPFDRPSPLVEPLTHRERDILARLASNLYGREIAEALTLSPNSIKGYTRQIYAKLGVNSRQEALRRARELGLLDPKTTPPFHSHNLPATITPFVGRQNELAQVRQLLANPDYRLLTLTGAGGAGKTRLALRVANELQATYPQGAWLAELASLSSPELLAQTVAAAFNLRPELERPSPNVLIDYLRDKNLLLVLDNCEHLLAACASLANSLLLACPNLHILATSRERLGIEAEQTYLVPSLSFPELGEKKSPQELIQYDAIDLFIRRARTALPDFELDEENAEAVTGICRHLDGIPLALELAAARLRVMGAEQIASQLEDRFRLLTGGDRSALPRLQTMLASIEWSVQLLSEAERTLLRRLSVFAGGWALPAAKGVCVDDSLREVDIFDLLGNLVNKSLVLVMRKKGKEIRYRLLETVRQYAHEKFNESDEAGRFRDRHLDYFLRLAERAEPELIGPEQAAWFDRLELEHDNFRLALSWSLEGGTAGPEAGLRLVDHLWWFWFMRGYRIEGGQWMERILKISSSQSLDDLVTRAKVLARLGFFIYDDFRVGEEALALGRSLGPAGQESVALALWGLGAFALERGDYARTKSLEEQSLQLFRELGHRWGICEALNTLGWALTQLGDLQQATVVLEESLGLARQAHDVNEIASALDKLGDVAMAREDYEQAEMLFKDSYALYSEINLRGGDWLKLGDVALQKGDTHLAASRYKDTLAMYWDLGDEFWIKLALERLARVAAACKQPERAVRLSGAAEALWESCEPIIQALFPRERLEHERFLEALRPQLDPATWAACWAEGRVMTARQAVAYALEAKDS